MRLVSALVGLSQARTAPPTTTSDDDDDDVVLPGSRERAIAAAAASAAATTSGLTRPPMPSYPTRSRPDRAPASSLAFPFAFPFPPTLFAAPPKNARPRSPPRRS